METLARSPRTSHIRLIKHNLNHNEVTSEWLLLGLFTYLSMHFHSVSLFPQLMMTASSTNVRQRAC